MKWFIVAAIVLAFLFPVTAEAKRLDTAKFTAGTAGGSIRLEATSYTVINDGTNNFFWYCSGEDSGNVDIGSTDAELKANESLKVENDCHTMVYDTTTGNATIRIFYFK